MKLNKFRIISNGKRFRPQILVEPTSESDDGYESLLVHFMDHSELVSGEDCRFGEPAEFMFRWSAERFIRKQYGATADISERRGVTV